MRLSVILRRMHFLLLPAIAVSFFSCTEVSSESQSVPAQQNEKTEAANQGKMHKAAALLKDGDLVLRTGNDFISFALRQFSQQDNTYSHCGLVRIQNGKTWVYHAIGGEDNPGATLRKENFYSFCNPKFNTGFGVFRYNLNASQKRRLDSLVDRYYYLKIPFDMNFNLQTDSSFYCAEFVYKAVTRAARSRQYLPVSYLHSFEYEAIDNLYLNPHTKAIYQTKFK